MKNSIWVGRNDYEGTFQSDIKLHINQGCVCSKKYPDGLHSNQRYRADIFNLNLKPLEIVEIIIDTDTQTYVVKRQREVGWYLTAFEEQSQVTARYWNGNIWKPMPRYNLHCSDENITVVSSIIKDNEYLRGLE